jgi:hypothetical protein
MQEKEILIMIKTGLRCKRPSPNGRFRKMAALPRVERYFVIFRGVARVRNV